MCIQHCKMNSLSVWEQQSIRAERAIILLYALAKFNCISFGRRIPPRAQAVTLV
jgi:hypothetical protein